MAKRRKTPLALAQIRQEKLLRDREAIRILRQHFTGYEASDGYSLDVRKIADLPRHLRRSLRAKYKKVSPLLSQSFDLVKPKTPAERKALRAFTHSRFRGMKHFIVKTPSAGSYVKMRAGAEPGTAFVELHTRMPMGVEVTEAYFLFSRRAKGPGDMATMLRKMLPRMPEGQYVLQTDTYGDTGSIVDKGKLMTRLHQYLSDYDQPKYGEHRFMNRVTGFRWLSTTVRGAEVQQGERDTIRARAREWNRKRREQLKREAVERARRERK